MTKFEESNFYKALQDFFINADKKTFLQFLAEFYNRTEGIINKNETQDEIIKELRELYLKFNEEGIDDNVVTEKVNYFLENSNKIQNIITELNTKVDKAGNNNITGNFTFNNNTGVKGKLTDGTVGNIAVLNTDNEVIVGTTSGKIKDVILASYDKERPLFMNQDLQRKELMLLNDRYKQQLLLSNFLVKLENNDTVKIICMGDSLTYGQNTSESSKRPANSDTTLDPNSPTGFEQAQTTYPEYLKELLENYYGSNKTISPTVVNRGVCGHTAEWGYQQWSNKKINGDVVIICYGNNDNNKNIPPNDYIKYLEKIILKYESWGIPSILLVPPRMKTTSEDKFRGYKNAIRNLGSAYGVPVLDGDQFHFGYQSSDIFDSDLVHFTELGYKIIANRVFSALLQLTKKNIIKDKTMIFPYGDRNSYYKKGSVWEQVAGNGLVLNNTNNNSMAIVIGGSGKVTFPIYTEDMLVIIPLFTKTGSGKVRISINTGIQQNKELYHIDTQTFKSLPNFITPVSNYEYSGNNFNVDIDNSYWNKSLIGKNDSSEKGIPYLTSIGYNNITIQNLGSDNVILQGLYFHKLY